VQPTTSTFRSVTVIRDNGKSYRARSHSRLYTPVEIHCGPCSAFDNGTAFNTADVISPGVYNLVMWDLGAIRPCVPYQAGRSKVLFVALPQIGVMTLRYYAAACEKNRHQ